MSLIPYDPFRQLATMRKEFDQLFNEFPSFMTPELSQGNIRVDVQETEDKIIATCDIPGLEKKEDVQIDIENNMLKISGTIKRSNEIKEGNMHRQERYIGSFHRSVLLPTAVSQDGVTASYKNGVLEVIMPKADNDNSRKIDVSFH